MSDRETFEEAMRHATVWFPLLGYGLIDGVRVNDAEQFIAALESTNASLQAELGRVIAERDETERVAHQIYCDERMIQLGRQVAEGEEAKLRVTDLTTLLRETREDADRLRWSRDAWRMTLNIYCSPDKQDEAQVTYASAYGMNKNAAHDALPASEGAEA